MGLSIRKYKKGECITFKSTKGKYGALSNMAPDFPIKIASSLIKTSEALYQALRFPDYPWIQRKIISYNSPITAKRFSREHIDKTRFDWDNQRFKIMRFCIELKYLHNKEIFYRVLTSTKNLPIVEYTIEDKVWGATEQGNSYVGTNALGRLLMGLRQKVIENNFEITIPNVQNFKFLGEEIILERIQPTRDIQKQTKIFLQ